MRRGSFSLLSGSVLCMGLIVSASPGFADEASILRKIDDLQRQVASQAAQLKKLEEQSGAPPSAPPASDTSFGGYGEIAYNAYRKDGGRDQADLKRFVIFLGHRFGDAWTFNSEVEWEHSVASADDQGETEIEQAYLSYRAAPSVNVKAGLILMPFGFLNTAHEPPVFHGVERNEVETRIIPSTWREGGVAVNHSAAFGLTTELGVTTGFDVAKFDDPGFPLGGIHQELQLAKARDLSFYGALNYQGVPGLAVGGAAFTGNAGQGNADFKAALTAAPDFSGVDARVTLWETHARWQWSGLDLEALCAQGSIGDAARIDGIIDAFNAANSTDLPAVPKRFNGGLLQAAFTVWQKGDVSLTPFVRYESFNTQAELPAGFSADPANADHVTTAGFSFKPHPQVVFKADYQKFNDNGSNDRTNLGLGYMF